MTSARAGGGEAPARAEHHPAHLIDEPQEGQVVTSIFITFDRMADRLMSDALRAKGVTLAGHGATDVELYQGDVRDTADAVDAWFADLPWTPDDTATLVAYSRDVTITTVYVDGEAASTTRADTDGVLVDDYLEDAA